MMIKDIKAILNPNSKSFYVAYKIQEVSQCENLEIVSLNLQFNLRTVSSFKQIIKNIKAGIYYNISEFAENLNSM